MIFWKILGFAGTAMFASRWVLQAIVARRQGQSVVTPSFWLVTMCGSFLLVLYFGFGPRADVVGLLGNALPFTTASYNLVLAARSRRPNLPAAATGPATRTVRSR